MAKLLSRVLSKRLNNYVTQIMIDYKNALIEIKTGMARSPGKAGTTMVALGGLIYLMQSNPNERCFLDQLITSRNDLILIDEGIRNPSSAEHVSFLSQCQEEKTLKRLDLLFASFLFRHDLSTDCALYINQCEYLKPSYIEYLTERLVDFGIAGKWRILDGKMVDYDVNPQEWS